MDRRRPHPDRMKSHIDAYLDHLRAADCSSYTVRARENVLRRLHAALPRGISRAATEQIEAWLAQPGWAPWTRYTYAHHIRAFFRWATEARRLDGDPACRLGRQRQPRSLPDPVDDDELRVALQSPEPWFIAVVLAAYAGLRADEIGRAEREHITQARVFVPRGKGGRSGVVPTHPYLWSVVVERPPGLLFRLPMGGQPSGPAISSAARRHFDRMGLPRVRLHRFRYWYGTTIQELVGDSRVTQECLRHENLRSTQGYTVVADSRRAMAVALLPVPGTQRR